MRNVEYSRVPHEKRMEELLKKTEDMPTEMRTKLVTHLEHKRANDQELANARFKTAQINRTI
jgi:hypothetical protein